MLEVKNLYKRYGNIVAVNNISFEAKIGDVLGFLGPNGAGKSTTMKILACFLAPDGGTAKIGGYDILQQPVQVRERLGYVAENAPAYEEMRVYDFLKFTALIRRLHPVQSAIHNVIELCGLDSVIYQVIGTLSKGYRRRVGLAQALIHDPDVLILDEPTDGLDPNQKFHVRNLIKNLASRKCIIVSTHILEEVDAICNRIIIIARGEKLVDTTPEGIRKEESGTLEEIFRKLTMNKQQMA